jgi:SAM-dependent methyltransferase
MLHTVHSAGPSAVLHILRTTREAGEEETTGQQREKPMSDTEYDDVLDDLRTSYDASAADRDGMAKQDWKLKERAAFLDRLQAIEARTLLEVGAGTGEDGVFFRDEGGISVTAVDLSPAMVRRCRAKGLDAYARDVLNLGFEPATFDAAYAMNCLLHVPDADLARALRAVRTVLRPGGLFFVGVYGGAAAEDIAAEDPQVPQRFFSFRTDEQIFRYVAEAFEVVDFHTVDDDKLHFQALTLARPL